MNYKISDIFYSLQGEGYFSGRAAVFIRFYGCNMQCSFCDEPLHTTRYQTFDEQKIINAINKYNCDNVVLTGGEPSIRNCNRLIAAFQELEKHVAVETNGFNFENIEEADWVTYSPKTENVNLRGWDEIKFVVNDETDIESILNIPEDRLIWIQPEAVGDCVVARNVEACCRIVKKYPHVRLSLQTHKLINIK